MENQSPETPLLNRSHTLRPLGVGDLLDQAVYFYRTHFLTLSAYIALFAVPTTLLTLFSSFGSSGLSLINPDIIETNPEVFSLTYCLSLLSSLLLSLITTVSFPLQAAGVGVALQGFLLEKRRVPLGEIFAKVRQQLAPLVGTGFIVALLTVPLLFTLVLPPVGLALLTFFGVASYLVAFVVLYERKRGLEAVRRSWILVHNDVWRTLRYVVIVYLFSTLLGVLIGGLFGVLLGVGATVADNPFIMIVGIGVLSILSNIIVTPLMLAIAGLLYFDLRVRYEGLDVALIAAEAAGEPLDLAAAPIKDEPALTDQVWQSILKLSGLYLLLVFLLCGCLVASIYMINAI